MRLWHKDLIPYLPRQQLIGQWRECCLIAKNIAEKGTPNHILVNKIINYSPEHFRYYCCLVYHEMKKRGYRCKWESYSKWSKAPIWELAFVCYHFTQQLFPDWHTGRYLKQCLYNLEEKYDCGGIPEDEWNKILTHFVW